MTRQHLLYLGIGTATVLALALLWALLSTGSEPGSASAVEPGRSPATHLGSGNHSPGSTGALGQNAELPLLKDLPPQAAAARLAEVFHVGDALERELRVLKMLRGMNATQVRDLLETVWNDPALTILQRYELSEYLFSRLGELDVTQGLSTLFELVGGDPRGAQRELVVLMRDWAMAEPAAALDIMREHLDGSDLGTYYLGHVLYPLARDDPQRAYNLARQMPRGSLDHRAYRHLFQLWSQRDPEAAAKAALTAPVSTEDNQRLFFIREFGTRWAQEDRAAALGWVQSLDNDWDRGHILEGIVDAWGRENPQEAIAWVDSLPADDLQTQRAIRKVAQGWRSLDGQYDAAVEWAMPRLTENFARNLFVEEVTRHYYEQDAQRAADFVENLPAGPSRDAGIRQLIGPVTDADPSAGFQWAQALGTTADRQLHMEQAARQWLQTDPDAAIAAIGQSDLPVEVKQELTRRNQ